MKNRPTFADFKKRALADQETRREYDKLEERYKIIDMLITMRKKAGLTQEDVAKIMNTTKSNISRLESYDYKSSPKISTVIEYAHATGHKLDFVFG